MDRAPAVLSTTKICANCAHFIPDGGSAIFAKCGAAPKVDEVSGEVSFYRCSSQRQFDCGPEAVHFIPSEDHAAKKSVLRLQRHRALEDALADLRPEPCEAVELLDALMAGLEARFDDRLPDVEACAKELRDALEEAEGVSDGFPS